MEILKDGDPFLQSPTKLVEDFSTIKDESYKMVQIMIENKGIGLAANQVGLDKSFFVMGSEEEGFLTIANPIIKEISEEAVSIEEGCLSFPNLYVNITRPKEIVTRFIDMDGKEQDNIRFEGMAARVFLHEYDHLQGITFDSRVSPMRLRMAKKKRSKLVKKMNRKNGTKSRSK